MKIVYGIHPAANLFPVMSDAAMEELKTSIMAHGQQEAIVLLDGKIIDGRNRYRACDELGIEPIVCELNECRDPITYVVARNLHRRHLTTSQRAAIAAKLATTGHGGDRKSEKIKGSNGPLKIDDAAKLLNVSPKSVKRAKAKKEGGKASGGDRRSAAAKQNQDSRTSTKPKPKRDDSKRAAKQAAKPTSAPTITEAEIGYITNQLNEIVTLLDQTACEINEVIPTVSNSVISQWHGLIDEITRHANATFKSLSEAGQSTTDVDAIRSRFSVVKLDGVWMPAIDGAVFMGVDNAFSTKRAATKSVEYWREKCANDSQEFERISEDAKRYREAASGAYPVIENWDNEWHVILPNMTDSGPYRTKRDAESRAQSLRNQFAGGAGE